MTSLACASQSARPCDDRRPGWVRTGHQRGTDAGGSGPMVPPAGTPASTGTSAALGGSAIRSEDPPGASANQVARQLDNTRLSDSLVSDRGAPRQLFPRRG